MEQEEIKDFFEEYHRRALKSLKTEEIEQMIAKVLGDAVNREFHYRTDFNSF